MDVVERIDFDPDTGLVPAVVQSDEGRVLMLAYMDRRAVERTLETGRVTFWSRSREELWTKGETSGNWLEAREIRTDCDGDAVLVRARPHGPTCHTGEKSCFRAGVRRKVDAEPAPPGAAAAEVGAPGSGDEEAEKEADAADTAEESSPGTAPRRAARDGAEPAGAPPAGSGGGPPRGDADGPDLSRAGPSPAPVLASVIEELVGVVARRGDERPEGSYTVSLLEAGPEAAARKVGEEALEVALSARGEPARLAEESADLLYHLAVLWRTAGLPADAVGRVLAERRGAPAAAGPGSSGAADPGDAGGDAGGPAADPEGA